MGGRALLAVAVALVAVAVALTRVLDNQYYYFAAYVILQYIVLATAWNILGGYTGYVNFGSAAFFAIATLALAVVLQTLIMNWRYVGGSRGIYTIRPAEVPFFANYVELLFVVMLLLALGALATAWWIEHSWVGRGLMAIRDNEEAAECMGVPTLKLKLLATTVSGALMGIAGTPFPYYLTYMEPTSAFNLDYAVNSLAMPMIGGTTTWVGPLVGAVLLGTVQQVATVTISSALNLLIVGVVVVAFVILAPEGIVGLFRRKVGKARA